VKIKKTKVKYKSAGKFSLYLYIFREKKDSNDLDKLFPSIIFFHGGGWRGGDPNPFFPQCKELAKEGYVAISAEYRLNDIHKTTPIECVEDGKSAIRWLKKHAHEYSIDPNLIAAGGGSAGGHVGLCTALIENLESKDEDLSISSVPKAVVVFNPVVDTVAFRDDAKEIMALFKGKQALVSPIQNIKKNIVPILIFHGTADTAVPFSTVEDFTQQMLNIGNNCELVSFDGKGHGFFNYRRNRNKPFKKTMKLMKKFLNENLR
jgi:acetyl esterase/lipase